MALTKISRGLLSTGISDSSDATAITIDSSENILLSNTTSLIGVNTSDGSDNKSVMINGGGSASDSRGAYVWIKGNEHSDAGFLQLNAGNVSGAGIKFFTSGTETMRIASDGVITQTVGPATAGAVGTYALLWRVDATTANSFGDTLAGSNLRAANTFLNAVYSNWGYGGTSVSGTWRCMGQTGIYNGSVAYTTNIAMTCTVWVRVS
tara:strand:- start:1170 stop:1790 length:621 start_codon:yes stop_codon:yes gene_type:complete